MNCAVYIKGSNQISYFVKNGIVHVTDTEWHVSGSIKLAGIKKALFGLLWTNDDCQPVLDGNGNQTGWDKTISQLNSVTGIELAKETKQEISKAIEIRHQIAGMSYLQVDSYIDSNVVDLASARAFLKVLAKVVLAVIKIQESRG